MAGTDCGDCEYPDGEGYAKGIVFEGQKDLDRNLAALKEACALQAPSSRTLKNRKTHGTWGFPLLLAKFSIPRTKR